MFKEERTGYRFQWKDLGNIEEGRPNLGATTAVAVYRLMEYTLRDVLITRYGVQAANEIISEAGKLAGFEFCKNILNKSLDLDGFIADLQQKLRDLNVGILRIESADLEKHAVCPNSVRGFGLFRITFVGRNSLRL